MRHVTVLSAASFAVLGACITVPGALLPLVIDDFGIRLVEAGSMLAFQNGGYLCSVFAAARIIRRLGLKPALIGCLLTSALGLAAFGLVSTWTAGAATLFASGLGFGLLEVGVNTLLITVGGARRANLLNLAHLFFGVGSFVAPAAATRAVAAGTSWRLVFAIVGLVTAAAGLAWSALARSEATAAAAGPERAARALVSPPTLLLAVLLGAYVGAEIGIGSWLTKYLTSVRALSLTEAGAALSIYWLGLVAGRLALAGHAHRVRDESLLVALAAASTAALASGLAAERPAVAVACFGLTGLGFSGIFPAVMALGARHDLAHAAGVTSVLVAGGATGGVVIPWTMSAIADRAGLGAGMAFYVAIGALMIVLALVVARTSRGGADRASAPGP